VDVSANGITASGDFIVAIEWLSGCSPTIGNDWTAPNNLRSIQRPAGSPDWSNPLTSNYMIRAVIDPNMGPVGGVVVPTSKLEIVAPFAALAGLIVAVSAVAAVKRRNEA
jgi:hypothetical protein